MNFREQPSVEKESMKSQFAIETIHGPEGSEVSFSPERGGIITSLKLRGVEVLYMNQETFIDPSKNVKGGIPILFPNAGPLEGENNPYPDLKQHGFARLSRWHVQESGEKTFREKLSSDGETRKVFPYDLEMGMQGELHDDGSVTLVQETRNTEEERAMPLSMGLHPYFRVSNEEKRNIKFNFPGGEIVEQDFDCWSQGGTTSIDNPKVNDPNAVLRVSFPGIGVLVMDVSPEYKKIWVWSMPGSDFVCVEPVMRDIGGLIDAPEMVAPGETFSGKVTFRLEE